VLGRLLGDVFIFASLVFDGIVLQASTCDHLIRPMLASMSLLLGFNVNLIRKEIVMLYKI
jgi:hypothetical protein